MRASSSRTSPSSCSTPGSIRARPRSPSSRPWRIPPRDVDAPADFPEVGDYALIGDCRTAALVSNRGSVEWLCLPSFSDASLFGAILDRRAGHFAVETATGVARLTDCVVLPDEGKPELYPQHELLRRVECASGTVDIEVSFAPRPDYGRVTPQFRKRGKLGWQLVRCPFGATLASGIALEEDPDRGRLTGRATLKAGDACWLSFCYDEHEAS